MKRPVAFLVVAAVVLSAGYALAGDRNRDYVITERWTQEATVGDKVVVIYRDERVIQKVTTPPSSSEARWAQPKQQSSRWTIPAIPYHLEEGETVSDMSRYTEKPVPKKILRATGITEKQARKLRVNDPVAIPEKDLKPEYRDPLKRIDELRAQLAEFQEKNDNFGQAKAGLEKKIKELEALRTSDRAKFEEQVNKLWEEIEKARGEARAQAEENEKLRQKLSSTNP